MTELDFKQCREKIGHALRDAAAQQRETGSSSTGSKSKESTSLNRSSSDESMRSQSSYSSQQSQHNHTFHIPQQFEETDAVLPYSDINRDMFLTSFDNNNNCSNNVEQEQQFRSSSIFSDRLSGLLSIDSIINNVVDESMNNNNPLMETILKSSISV
jgi:hypothetical protein